MKLNAGLSRIADLLFPPHCIFCGEVIAPGLQLCAQCEAKNPRVHVKKRITLPETGKTIQCSVPFVYDGNVRKSIIEFKFYGKPELSNFFGSCIADELEQEISAFDLVTSVPISVKRRKQRGYNQSELIARRAAKQMQLPYCETLVKKLDNKEQHKLSERERSRNVRGVYASTGDSAIGKRILLIDDIITTGATLAECAVTLFQAGAQAVSCAAIAEVELS